MKTVKTMMLAVGVMGAAMIGCGSGNTMPDNQPTDAAGDTGGGGDSGMCTPAVSGDGGTCYRVTRCENTPFCPAQVTNSQTTPNFVITQIDLTQPPSLVSTGPVGRLLNTALTAGTAFWGISLNISSATAGTIRTGALQQGPMPGNGTGFLTSTFQYFNGGAPTPGAATRFDPVMGNITLTGEQFTTEAIALITIPLYNEADHSLLAELPLRNAAMRNVNLTSMRNCIGLAKSMSGRLYNSCVTGLWNTTDPTSMMPAGIIEGDMTVEDARNVQVPSLNTNLCSVIAGSDCTMVPQAMWTNQPDTMVGGTTNNAWHLRGAFTAVAATIQ